MNRRTFMQVMASMLSALGMGRSERAFFTPLVTSEPSLDIAAQPPAEQAFRLKSIVFQPPIFDHLIYYSEAEGFSFRPLDDPIVGIAMESGEKDDTILFEIYPYSKILNQEIDL